MFLIVLWFAFLLMLLLYLMDKPVFDLVPWLFYLGIVITALSSLNFLEKVEKADKGYVDKGFELRYHKLS